MDLFWEGLLLFTNWPLIVVLALIGLLTPARSLFGVAFLLYMFTTIYNPYLKSIWMLPLPPTPGISGFGFPSGHLHTAFVFWGWLFIHVPKLLGKLLLASFVLLGAISTVHHGYHYPSDIFGAIAFGSLTLSLCYWLSHYPIFAKQPARLGWVLLSIVPWIIFHTETIFENQVWWLVIGGLLGFTVGWRALGLRPISISRGVITTIVALGLGYSGYWLATHYPMLPLHTSWVLSGFWVTFSYFVVRRVSTPATDG